jgi:hypothetical protein
MQPTLPAVKLAAKPQRLKDGSWGARVSGRATIGDTITITTRGGDTWDARVVALEWEQIDQEGEVTMLVATDTGDRPRRGVARRGRRGRGSSYSRFSSGAESYQNRDGRCEDAPCCGCCS